MAFNIKNTTLNLLVFVLLSCSTGPTDEKKSPLNYFSGEHYRADQSIVPFQIKRYTKNTTISGKVFFLQKNDDFEYPLRFKKIFLEKDNKIIVKTNTDSLGKFSINSNLSNGKYILRINDSDYSGSKEVEVSSYIIKDIKLKTYKNQ